MFPRGGCFVVAACLVVAGCGVRPITGGTKGTLRASGAPLSEVQITVHQVDGSATQPIGFGVSGSDGTLELVTRGAKGPLNLAPGEYCCTLESVGAPVQIPPEYAQPATTPLKVSWTASDRSLDFDVPIRLTP